MSDDFILEYSNAHGPAEKKTYCIIPSILEIKHKSRCCYYNVCTETVTYIVRLLVYKQHTLFVFHIFVFVLIYLQSPKLIF